METRKKYVALNQALYEQIKRLLQKESKKDYSVLLQLFQENAGYCLRGIK